MIELALGTVQFGVAYGLQGRSQPVSDAEAKDILSLASRSGIMRLDTAAAYGDIEERLVGLIGDLDFHIVSKVPALPVDADDPTAFALASIEQSRRRLGERLRGVLFHRAADLYGASGNAVWEQARQFCASSEMALGVSVYDPAEACFGNGENLFDMVQLPGNVFDQRLQSAAGALGSAEISVRSAFLQGLLLLPYNAAVNRVPQAAGALRRWHDWCDHKGISPLVAALSVIKGLSNARYCIIGVDDVSQLEDILVAWDKANAISASELAIAEPEIIDPRRWKRAAEVGGLASGILF